HGQKTAPSRRVQDKAVRDAQFLNTRPYLKAVLDAARAERLSGALIRDAKGGIRKWRLLIDGVIWEIHLVRHATHKVKSFARVTFNRRTLAKSDMHLVLLDIPEEKCRGAYAFVRHEIDRILFETGDPERTHADLYLAIPEDPRYVRYALDWPIQWPKSPEA